MVTGTVCPSPHLEVPSRRRDQRGGGSTLVSSPAVGLSIPSRLRLKACLGIKDGHCVSDPPPKRPLGKGQTGILGIPERKTLDRSHRHRRLSWGQGLPETAEAAPVSGS